MLLAQGGLGTNYKVCFKFKNNVVKNYINYTALE